MQKTDISSITRDLAGLVAERYVFPGLAAEISRLLENGLAEDRHAAVPDEQALATALTQDLQSLNGDKHLRLLHSAAELPGAAELPAAAELPGAAERPGRPVRPSVVTRPPNWPP